MSDNKYYDALSAIVAEKQPSVTPRGIEQRLIKIQATLDKILEIKAFIENGGACPVCGQESK